MRVKLGRSLVPVRNENPPLLSMQCLRKQIKVMLCREHAAGYSVQLSVDLPPERALMLDVR